MSIPDDVQKVAIVSLPRNYLHSSSRDTGKNEQLIRTTNTEGSLFILDSLRSKTVRENEFQIETKNTFQLYNRMELLAVQGTVDIPTINQYNKYINIIYNGSSSGSIQITLTEGYYNKTALVDHVNVKIKAAIISSTLVTDLINADTHDYLTVTNKLIQLSMPLTNPGLSYEFQFLGTFWSMCKTLLGFHQPVIIVNDTETSYYYGYPNMIFTRSLNILSYELAGLTHSSFDGENDIRNLVGQINLGELKDITYLNGNVAVPFPLLLRGEELHFINIAIVDEHGNAWDFGYDINGDLLINQIKLSFLAHD